ncbi:MAG TPA: 2TM domain-containing protein [Caldilineaceae bacterium]|nr:2TM domain-containing protein [Caldilineaceae bacterium]
MNDEERYERARRRVQAIKGFYIHLLVYLFVNAGLLLINLLTSPGDWWFYWPLLGWGIGLAAHALAVFGAGGWFGEEWEEREIRKLLDKEKSGN